MNGGELVVKSPYTCRIFGYSLAWHVDFDRLHGLERAILGLQFLEGGYVYSNVQECVAPTLFNG